MHASHYSSFLFVLFYKLNLLVIKGMYIIFYHLGHDKVKTNTKTTTTNKQTNKKQHTKKQQLRNPTIQVAVTSASIHILSALPSQVLFIAELSRVALCGVRKLRGWEKHNWFFVGFFLVVFFFVLHVSRSMWF
jgi:hypothetical protein